MPQLSAVTNRATNVSLPVDPLSPDPLAVVNVTTLDSPNARATEFQVVLPLAFFVSPISATPGRLDVELDLEEKR